MILNCEATVNAFLTSCHSCCGESSGYVFSCQGRLAQGGGCEAHTSQDLILLFQETIKGKDSCQTGTQIHRPQKTLPFGKCLITQLSVDSRDSRSLSVFSVFNETYYGYEL